MSYADPNTIAKRMRHASSKEPRSALDEMLRRRVPIQLGGMTDPFTEVERKYGVTYKIMEIMNYYNYPVLISSKSLILGSENYLALLKAGNYLVRVSMLGAPSEMSQVLDQGVPSIDSRLRMIEKLSAQGVSVAVRMQPILPGYEDHAIRIAELSISAGAKQVSAEYLKWPVENKSHQNHMLSRSVRFGKNEYIASGAEKVGREYVLPSEFKLERLLELKRRVESLGAVFGFAENDLLHLNNFVSCCNAADLFLRQASFFSCNILSSVKVEVGEKIRFSSLYGKWYPKSKVGTYLNSKSRIRHAESGEPDWLNIVRQKWNSKAWRGGPESFYGIENSGERDSDGNQVYRRVF